MGCVIIEQGRLMGKNPAETLTKLFGSAKSFINLLFRKVIPFNLSRLFPSRKGLWLFGAWYGREFSDNAKYLYLHVRKNCPEIKALWITDNPQVMKELSEMGHYCLSAGTFRALAAAIRAEAVFYTHGFEDICSWNVFGNSLEINLDHGLIVKPRDPESPFKQKIRKAKLFLHDQFRKTGIVLLPKMERFICSLNQESVQNLAQHHFHDRRDHCLVTGYPRIDRILRSSDQERGSFTVTYLPTYRGDGPGLAPLDPFKENGVLKNLNSPFFQQLLERRNIRFIIKPHGIFRITGFPFDQEFHRLFPEKGRVELYEETEYTDLQHLLSETDLLITDFSSVWIDFLPSLRPMIFACYDKEEYLSRWGWRYPYDQITPGPQCRNLSELCVEIEEAMDRPEKWLDRRESILSYFHFYRDGRSCERIVDFALSMVNRNRPQGKKLK